MHSVEPRHTNTIKFLLSRVITFQSYQYKGFIVSTVLRDVVRILARILPNRSKFLPFYHYQYTHSLKQPANFVYDSGEYYISGDFYCGALFVEYRYYPHLKQLYIRYKQHHEHYLAAYNYKNQTLYTFDITYADNLTTLAGYFNSKF